MKSKMMAVLVAAILPAAGLMAQDMPLHNARLTTNGNGAAFSWTNLAEVVFSNGTRAKDAIAAVSNKVDLATNDIAVQAGSLAAVSNKVDLATNDIAVQAGSLAAVSNKLDLATNDIAVVKTGKLDRAEIGMVLDVGLDFWISLVPEDPVLFDRVDVDTYSAFDDEDGSWTVPAALDGATVKMDGFFESGNGDEDYCWTWLDLQKNDNDALHITLNNSYENGGGNGSKNFIIHTGDVFYWKSGYLQGTMGIFLYAEDTTGWQITVIKPKE